MLSVQLVAALLMYSPPVTLWKLLPSALRLTS